MELREDHRLMAALPYVSYYLLLALVSGVLASLVWRRRYYRSGRPLTLVLVSVAFWCGCRAMAAADPTFQGTLFWSLLQFGGIIPIMPAWLMLALSFMDHRWRRKPIFIGALFAPALAFFVIAISNSIHGLWFTSVEPDLSRGYMWVRDERGPLFYAHALYAYLCFAAGAAILARNAVRAGPVERRQSWLMFLAAIIPVAGNVAYLTGVYTPLGDDPTPTLLFIGGLLAFYATIHFRLVDLNPLVAREALRAFPDGMIVLDNEQEIAEINRVAAELFGSEPSAALGRPLSALLVGSPLGAALRPVMGGLARVSSHFVSFEEGAGERTLEVRMRPLFAENGAVAGSLLLLRDVSERARGEQARTQHLAELSLLTRVARAANTAADAASLLRAVTETIADAGIWERVAVGLLAPGGRHLSVVADIATDGLQGPFEGQLIGGPEGQALIDMLRDGRSRAVNLDDPELVATPLGQALREEGLSQLLVTPLYHQGAPLGLLVLGSLAPGPQSQALLRIAETVGELITDAVVRARLYDESRQADRLKASFLASVSHELRTPLTSIIGYVEMLQKGAYGTPAEKMREPLSFMRQSSNTLLRLINDILDFSRAEAGYLKVDLQPVDVLRCAANVVGQLQPQLRERGLEFDFDVPLGLPLVQANAARLEQVLTNLLSNAVKFTEAGRVRLRAWSEGEYLLVSVSDTGIGIAPEHLELIFQEFRRVEPKGRRTGGTGLGLAISRRLVELMGGMIQVQSAPGEGSTFTVQLLVARQAPELSVPAASGAPSEGRGSA
jgi:PAS domain S-box-containing protein